MEVLAFFQKSFKRWQVAMQSVRRLATSALLLKESVSKVLGKRLMIYVAQVIQLLVRWGRSELTKLFGWR